MFSLKKYKKIIKIKPSGFSFCRYWDNAGDYLSYYYSVYSLSEMYSLGVLVGY